MLGHPSVRPPIRPSARDDKQSMQGISPILAVPFLARRRAAWEQFGILRGVNFWGMREFSSSSETVRCFLTALICKIGNCTLGSHVLNFN